MDGDYNKLDKRLLKLYCYIANHHLIILMYIQAKIANTYISTGIFQYTWIKVTSRFSK